MKDTPMERFAQVLAVAACDGEYRELTQQCEELDRPFRAVMEKLSQKDRATIMDYIRTLGASALRLTEIACETI